MKKVCFLTIIFSLFLHNSYCQTKPEVDSNFIGFQSALREYKIDSCLVGLLTDIEESDSMNLTYPPNQFFYDLAFSKKEKIREMTIGISRWQKAKSLDYSGVIVINHMSFLCRGDFKDDKLFSETKNAIEIKLKKPKLYQYDDMDVMFVSFIYYPALIGRYELCGGLPINIYVYNGKKMKGYSYKYSPWHIK